MLDFGIDQHARQITISLRDDQGDVLQARQVSTQPEKVPVSSPDQLWHSWTSRPFGEASLNHCSSTPNTALMANLVATIAVKNLMFGEK